jgi:hypothetical protein
MQQCITTSARMEHLFTRETTKGESKKVKGKSEAATAFY